MALLTSARRPSCQKAYSAVWQSLSCDRLFGCSAPVLAGKKYRESIGLAGDGLEYGPLTDIPDWSYIDGSGHKPLSFRGKLRLKKRFGFSRRISTLLEEVRVARAKYQLKNRVPLEDVKTKEPEADKYQAWTYSASAADIPQPTNASPKGLPAKRLRKDELGTLSEKRLDIKSRIRYWSMKSLDAELKKYV